MPFRKVTALSGGVLAFAHLQAYQDGRGTLGVFRQNGQSLFLVGGKAIDADLPFAEAK